MDQPTAQHLFDVGAILVLLDVPQKTEIGIDMHSWHTDTNFKGIKMIPPGLHFVYFTTSASEDGCHTSPRSGFFRFFSEREIVVRSWNPSMETFDVEIGDEVELERFRQNKKELDRYCGPYPYESYKKWVSLSQHITADTVMRIQPKSGFVLSASSLVSEPSDTASRAAKPKPKQVPLEKLNTDNLMQEMAPSPNDVMNYTPVRRFPLGCNPKTITQCAVDSDLLLKEFISHCDSCKGVVAELQTAFVCFLIGQQFESFDQWKKLVALLCNNQSSVDKYENMYTDLMNILHFQMKEIPEDFFVDIVSSENFLTDTLNSLFTNIANSSASQQLKSRAKRFSENLSKRFGWYFEDEADDCAPVIVDEHGNY